MKNNRIKNKFKSVFNRKNIGSFMDKHGFYIVLFLCVCIIGATAFFTSESRFGLLNKDIPEEEIAGGPMEESDEEVGEVADGIDIRIKDIIMNEDNEPFENKEATQEDIDTQKSNDSEPQIREAENQETSEVKATEVSAPKESSSSNLMIPVEGDIIKEYAMDSLVYSRTLKEWTTHPGIDIDAPLGTEVKAALDGVVEEVLEDPLMGIIIVIDHGDGLKTKYANLSTGDMVRVEQKVEKGQTISGVGRTASIEISDPPHLHFEVIQDGKNVDPMKYIE